MSMVLHQRIISTSILAMSLVFGFSVQQSSAQIPTGCCMNGSNFCVSSLTQSACDSSYTSGSAGSNFSSGKSCAQVTACAVTGKCQKTDGSNCSDKQKWECDDLYAQGFRFFEGQSCGAITPTTISSCCVQQPSAGGTSLFCESNVDQATCKNSRLGTFYSSSCNAVPNCPQALNIGSISTDKPVPEPITFTPEIAIPGLFSGETIVTGTTILSYVRAIFVLFIWSVGVLAVVMVIYGGIKWVAAAGNAGQINDARDIVNNAIIGVIIALTSIVLLNTINPSLVDIRGILPGFVRQQAYEERSGTPFKSGVTLVSGDYQTIAQRVRAHPEWITAIRSNSTNQVPAERILAILFIESAGVQDAKSSAGAYGLMQLLPSTANEFGVRTEDLNDGVKNIGGGARYLQSLALITCPAETSRTECNSGHPCINGDWRYINPAYNGGRAANYCSQSCSGQTWSQCVENEGYAETRNYINKAEDAYQWIIKNNFFGSS